MQRDPKTSKEEAEEIARLQLMLIQKKLHLAQLSRSAARDVESQRSLPKSTSRSPQRLRVSLSQSPERSLEKSAVSQNRAARDRPVLLQSAMEQGDDAAVRQIVQANSASPHFVGAAINPSARNLWSLLPL